jgi:hypothetical protein
MPTIPFLIQNTQKIPSLHFLDHDIFSTLPL